MIGGWWLRCGLQEVLNVGRIDADFKLHRHGESYYKGLAAWLFFAELGARRDGALAQKIDDGHS